ncbi:hypothetical protein [Streptomyces luteogriseus]|uniref:hypothetical protein n=1 Tax=Streptomyces luteogriseus TaxID=68233 RepID=UPI0037BB9FBE
MAQVISNPPFDERISSLSGLQSVFYGPQVSQLSRGYIIQDPGIGRVQYSVRFLYNPSIVQVSHQTDAANAPVTPQNYRNPLDKGEWNIPLSASISFNLLFDRTYELWKKSGPKSPTDFTQGSGEAGVRVDVEALYRVVGIYQPTAVQPPTTSPSTTPSNLYSNGDPGPMPLTPVTVYFGGPRSLSYRGYISSLDVQWTHFSQLMVPMRCTIGVSMNLMTKNSWESDYASTEEE